MLFSTFTPRAVLRALIAITMLATIFHHLGIAATLIGPQEPTWTTWLTIIGVSAVAYEVADKIAMRFTPAVQASPGRAS